jgi:hypothetical protein
MHKKGFGLGPFPEPPAIPDHLRSMALAYIKQRNYDEAVSDGTLDSSSSSDDESTVFTDEFEHKRQARSKHPEAVDATEGDKFVLDKTILNKQDATESEKLVSDKKKTPKKANASEGDVLVPKMKIAAQKTKRLSADKNAEKAHQVEDREADEKQDWDALLEIRRLRVAEFVEDEDNVGERRRKLELNCYYEDGKWCWDDLKYVQIDYPFMVGAYFKCNQSDFLLAKHHTGYVFPEGMDKVFADCGGDYETIYNLRGKPKARARKVFEETVSVQLCTNDHELLNTYSHWDQGSYFKEGQRLFDTKCFKCGNAITDKDVNHKHPVLVCQKLAYGCSTCVCNNCIPSLKASKRGRNK